MTAPEDSGRQFRRTLLVLAGLVVLAGGGLGLFWFLRERPARPPVVDLSGADEEVAALIESARREVQSEPRSARRWGHLGMVLRAHDFGGEANVCFGQAERLDPRDPAWPYYRGLTLVLTDPEEGIACLERAVARLDDSEVMPRFRLVEVLLEQGRLDEADRHLQRTSADDHPRGRLLRARLALARQDSKAALASLEGCWDDRHSRRQAHLLGAEAWQRLGDATKAKEFQTKAGQLPPDQPWLDPLVEDVQRLVAGVRARLSLALSLREQGRTDDSIRLLEQVAQEHPREASVWVLLGQTHQQSRDFAAAERAYGRALEIDADNLEGWFGLGLVRLERKPGEAAEAFRAVVRLKADHTGAHYLLGVCLKALGDRAGAREAWRQALRCQPDHGPTRKALAELESDGSRKP